LPIRHTTFDKRNKANRRYLTSLYRSWNLGVVVLTGIVMAGLSLQEYIFRRARLEGLLAYVGDNPWFAQVDLLAAQARSRGRSLVSFANYDYLGLSKHPLIVAAVADAMERFGAGALGSRLVGGELSIHSELERQITRFVGAQSCVATVSGYLANSSVISHLCSGNDLIVIDELSHNSIVTGASNNRAKVMTFKHNDIDHLDYILAAQRKNFRNCLIAVEGLYSMDGDFPDLPQLLSLKDKHTAWLLVDEAHSVGVLGEHGRGISEHFGEDPQRIDLIVGTLSKALVSCGGFICGHQHVVEWLKYRLPGFVYSVGMSPVIAAAAHAALKILIAEPSRVTRVQTLSEYFVKCAQNSGLSTGYAVGRGIVSILFADLKQAMTASEALLHHDIFAPPIVHFGVPTGGHRIRFFVTAAHEEHHIDTVLEILSAQNGNQDYRTAIA
jgi:8-amino-7-oxononanoate synthase